MYSPTDSPAAAPAPGSKRRFASRRWTVWQRQVRAGHVPCFGTPERFFCSDADCPFRGECRGLRASWQR